VIGLAISQDTAYNRGILRAICNWAETRRDWSFVSLNPRLDRPACESLKFVDAVVVSVNRPDFHRKLPRRLPMVDITDFLPHRAGLRVAGDNALIARVAAEHFLARGLRSIGYVGESQYFFSVERERTLCAVAKAAGCEFHVLNFPATDHDLLPMSFIRYPNTLLGDWLQSLPRPTGVLTPCDLWGVEILQTCQLVGLRVPEDIAVLGVDDDEVACLTARPHMSSVVMPTEAIGRRTASAIDAQLSRRVVRAFIREELLLPPLGIAVRRSTDVLAIDDPHVIAAVRFIHENCHQSINVSDVLNEVSVSRRWLERRIRSTIGTTISGEIRRSRLALAKRLLTQTDASIAEVADDCGYSDLRHIESVFKQELGISPTTFRRQARGQVGHRHTGELDESYADSQRQKPRQPGGPDPAMTTHSRPAAPQAL
jgi:LacI family transcriptional regulator